ncbi:MAG TPA: CoA transferase [Acidimicrobiia bacterium]|nr:CoA transferase [Acidimicrobiia bacterium]
MTGALAGVRIVDISTSYAGPTATMYLADMGADVVKVERPGGDDARAWGPPFVDGESAWFHSANRGKRSLAVDLRTPAGGELVHRLLERADVFVENLTTAKLAALGLDPDTVRARHPHLIYCAVSGFGFTGPDAATPGYDLVAQARSGLMSVTGARGGTPQRVSTALSDIVTGLVAAFAVTAALHRRHRTGEGEFVDVSLLDTDLALMAPRIASYLAGEPEPAPSGGTDSVLAVYQAFETADRPIIVAVGNDALWRRFCAAVELPELAADPALATNEGRRQARPRILPAIAARLAERPAAAWLARLGEASVPAYVIQSLSEVVADPQVRARRAIAPLDNGLPVVAPPWRFGSAPPGAGPRPAIGPVGADAASVLQDYGLAEAELAALLEAGALIVPAGSTAEAAFAAAPQPPAEARR